MQAGSKRGPKVSLVSQGRRMCADQITVKTKMRGSIVILQGQHWVSIGVPFRKPKTKKMKNCLSVRACEEVMSFLNA